MLKYTYIISEDSNFLMHHGIKGQQWGVQNGPPYPLDHKKILEDVETSKHLQPREGALGNYGYKHFSEKAIASKMSFTNKDIDNICDRNNKIYKDTNNYVQEIKNKFYKDDKETIQKIEKLYNMEYPQTKEQQAKFDKEIEKLFPKIKELDSRHTEIQKEREKLVNNIVGKYGDVKVNNVYQSQYESNRLVSPTDAQSTIKSIINAKINSNTINWYGGKPMSMLSDNIDDLFEELYYKEHPDDMSWD